MARRSGGTTSAKRRRRMTRVWMAVAALALVVNGVTVTTLLAGGGGNAETTGVSGVYDDARAARAVEIAATQVLGVVSLDAASGNPELTELSERTTAAFRTDFDDFVNGFLDQVRADGLEVRSRIAAAGLSDLGADEATVIVATSGEADRGEEPSQARDFQMRVSLAWIGDAWRVDNLEFV